MRRTVITILTAAVVLAGTAAVVQAAGSPEREAASASSAAAEPEKIAHRRSQAQAAVRCRSLGCLNRKLTTLYRDAYKCERVVNLTRYQGYLYTPDGSNATLTTALDYTGPGSTPSNQFVIYTC